MALPHSVESFQVCPVNIAIKTQGWPAAVQNHSVLPISPLKLTEKYLHKEYEMCPLLPLGEISSFPMSKEKERYTQFGHVKPTVIPYPV